MADKENILLFSRQKFLMSGITKVTMDEIAREMKISKKTLYKHFPSKNSLVHETIFDMLNSVRDSILKIIDGPQNVIEKLIGIGQIFFSIAKTFSESWLNDIRMNHHELWLEIDKFRTLVIQQNFAKIIEQGKIEGLFIDRPTPLVMTAFLGAVRSVINPEFLMNHSFTVKSAAEITLDLLFTGMLTKQGRKAYKQLKSEMIS
ncbi:MAG: TetR/AcrR family transcriptional regulator [Melioribacteraceae bacterium]|nr:TetR/AcrR family transcriptional regulator [Melioribacteraceae bacterium]